MEPENNINIEQSPQDAPVQMPAPKAKSNTPLIIILAVLALAGIGFGVYGMFFMPPKTVEKVVEKEVATSDFVIDSEKCLGDNCDAEFSAILYTQACGVRYEGYNIYVDYDEAKTCYPDIEQNGKEVVKIDDTKKIVDAKITTRGQAVGEEQLVLVYEDGTVGYMPLEKALKNNDIKISTFEDAERVIRIVQGSSRDVEGAGSGAQAFLQRTDGKFYLVPDIQ